MRLLNSGTIAVTLASLSVPGVVALHLLTNFSSSGAGALWSSWMAMLGYGLTGLWLVARCAGKAHPSLAASLLWTIGPLNVTLVHLWLIARQILWCVLLCLAIRALGVPDTTMYYMLAAILVIGFAGAAGGGVARLAPWHLANIAGIIVVVALMFYVPISDSTPLWTRHSDEFYWLVHDRPPFHWAAGLQALAFGVVMGLVDPAWISPILLGQSHNAAKQGVAAGVLLGSLLTGLLFLGYAIATSGSTATDMHRYVQNGAITWILLSWVCYSQGVYLAAQIVSLELLAPSFSLLRGRVPRVLLLWSLIAGVAMAGTLSEAIQGHVKDYYVLLITVDIPIISIFIYRWLWRPCTASIFWSSLAAGIVAGLCGHFLLQLSMVHTALLSHLATTVSYVAAQYITAGVRQHHTHYMTEQHSSTAGTWITRREKSLRISSAVGILLICLGSTLTGFGILIGAPVAILGFFLMASVFAMAGRRAFFYRGRIDS